jgi:hypothetical protein
LRLVLRHALPLFGLAMQRRQPHLAILALELAVPPLALFCAMLFVLLFSSSLLSPLGAMVPLLIGLTTTTLFVLALLLVWLCFGRRSFPIRMFLALPGYMIAKLPVYLTVLHHEVRRMLGSSN